MIEKVLDSIAKHRMLARGDAVVAAVSGGPDSVALLQVLVQIAPVFNLRIVVAHFNHGLRGEESDGDERFVRDLAAQLGLPLAAARADIRQIKAGRRGSLEEVAREERYGFLLEVASARKARRIALGHHGQDQAETVLINFLRGAGSDGLKGMLPVRDDLFIRPLLSITKEEIDVFLREGGYAFRNDSSNRSDEPLRNRVRRHLLPDLKRAFNPNMEATLARLGEIMRLEDDYLQMQVRDILSGWEIAPGRADAAIDIGEFLGLHEALQRRIVKTVLEGMAAQGQGIGYVHIQAAIDLCRGGKSRGRLHMPGGIRVVRTGGRIAFYAGGGTEAAPAAPYEYDLTVPGILTLAETGETVRAAFAERPADLRYGAEAYLDFDRVVPPLSIRSLRPGDRFQPLGLAGTQKLKKFFIDRKIGPERRWSMPLLADRQSVIWIPGLRLCDRVKITETTRRVLRIEII
jgi:tRNA(Ile)-lysidine synthase